MFPKRRDSKSLHGAEIPPAVLCVLLFTFFYRVGVKGEDSSHLWQTFSHSAQLLVR
jgi:hypothetical protein